VYGGIGGIARCRSRRMRFVSEERRSVCALEASNRARWQRRQGEVGSGQSIVGKVISLVYSICQACDHLSWTRFVARTMIMRPFRSIPNLNTLFPHSHSHTHPQRPPRHPSIARPFPHTFSDVLLPPFLIDQLFRYGIQLLLDLLNKRLIFTILRQGGLISGLLDGVKGGERWHDGDGKRREDPDGWLEESQVRLSEKLNLVKMTF
jgi:hypothetical protein